MLRLEIKCEKDRRQFRVRLYDKSILIKELVYKYLPVKSPLYIDRGDNTGMVDYILTKLLNCHKSNVGYKYSYHDNYIQFTSCNNEVGEKFYQITWNHPGCRYLAKCLEQLIPDLRYTLGCIPGLTTRLAVEVSINN